MEYVLDPPLCAETDLQCMRMRARLDVSSGDASLTPTAVQWVLKVRVKANGAALAFDMMENLLRCFVRGAFMERWTKENDAPMYEQESTGFTAVFPRGSAFPPATANRRQVREMHIMLEYALNAGAAAAHADPSALFDDTLGLADYGFSVWMQSAEQIAPAVFTSKYRRIASMQPYFRPLKLALGLDRDSTVLEQIAERAVVGHARPHLRQRARPRPHARQHPRPRRGSLAPVILANIEPSLVQMSMTGGATDPHADPHADPHVDPPDIWQTSGQFFRPAPFESRRFVVLTGDGDEVHECVFLSQLLKQA